MGREQCWERYFKKVISYSYYVTMFQKVTELVIELIYNK